MLAGSNYFDRNEEVLDACFSNLETISVKGPTNNAWGGTIMITKNGKAQNLSCINCSGGFSGPISGSTVVFVDGDGRSKDPTATWCLNGRTCTMILESTKVLFHTSVKIFYKNYLLN